MNVNYQNQIIFFGDKNQSVQMSDDYNDDFMRELP